MDVASSWLKNVSFAQMWRTMDGVKLCSPLRVNDLWGKRGLSKGKSRCLWRDRRWKRRGGGQEKEAARVQRQLQTPAPGRWITDVWPRAAPVNYETKDLPSLSLSLFPICLLFALLLLIPSSFCFSFWNLLSFMPALCLPTLSLLASMIHFFSVCVCLCLLFLSQQWRTV